MFIVFDLNTYDDDYPDFRIFHSLVMASRYVKLNENDFTDYHIYKLYR